MGANQNVVFRDGEAFDISGYSISDGVVSLHYEELKENLSGFRIIRADGEVIFDGSEYRHRWDVVDQKKNVIYYTNDPNYRQTEPWNDLSNIPEHAEPLTNEELTEAVADLMYDVSAAQLRL